MPSPSVSAVELKLVVPKPEAGAPERCAPAPPRGAGGAGAGRGGAGGPGPVRAGFAPPRWPTVRLTVPFGPTVTPGRPAADTRTGVVALERPVGAPERETFVVADAALSRSLTVPPWLLCADDVGHSVQPSSGAVS